MSKITEPRVEFFRHGLGEEEIQSVTEVLRSPFLTTGAAVQQLEQELAAYMGTAHAVGLTSCTAALHLALIALDIGPGDEVITTPMSFVATSNAILHVGATPVFVDVEPDTGNLDARRVKAAITSRTRAILPVHLYGLMADMRALRRIADAHGLAIVEDAAHALESARDGIRPGQLGDAACLSFYATKSITSGEGGALCANSPSVNEVVRRHRQHGMDLTAQDRYTGRFRHYDVTVCGWKYNMDNIQAALLLPQLPRVEAARQRREEICHRYAEAFERVGIPHATSAPNVVHARHLFTFLAPEGQRDAMLWSLQEKGIGVAVNYRPIHLLAHYRRTFGYEAGAFPIAEDIGNRTVTLPVYPKLTDAEVTRVVAAVLDVHSGA